MAEQVKQEVMSDEETVLVSLPDTAVPEEAIPDAPVAKKELPPTFTSVEEASMSPASFPMSKKKRRRRNAYSSATNPVKTLSSTP